jgi:hypothetical protein
MVVPSRRVEGCKTGLELALIISLENIEEGLKETFE